MRCCNGSTLAGTDSRCYLPTPIFSTRRGSILDGNQQVFFPKPIRPLSGRVRAKATAVNEALVSETNCDVLSFYELLGVSESVSVVEIKQAYKQMALKYHPDVSPPDQIEEYTRKFIRVQEAYETLSDPIMRDLYDRDMAKGLHLAFSARRRYHDHEEVKEKSGWKNRWQDQLSELKRRGMNKDTRSNMSWAARMRSQRDGGSE